MRLGIFFQITDIPHNVQEENGIHIPFLCRCYVEEKLGSKYVEVRNNSLAQTLKQMNAITPIFFILSPGIDPMRVSP